MMKSGFVSALVLAGVGLGGCATDGNTNYGQVLNDVLGGYGQALTEQDVTAGLKEALSIGAARAVAGLGKTDGFYGDELVHINLPGDLGKVQKQLQKVGLSAPFDDLELRLNRAAEAAAPTAKSLFVDAVTSMTIEDAMGILNGENAAATTYLRSRTNDKLVELFRPHMQTALNESGAVSKVSAIAGQYFSDSLIQGLQDDLASKAVDGALDGVFYYLAEEEKAIREDPAKRTTELLKRVFGGS